MIIGNDRGRIYFSFKGVHGYLSRLVMEEYLDRPLTKDEHVHHIDRDTLNDSIENLKVVSQSEHMSIHSVGNTNMLGKHHSEETKKKISEAQTGKSRNLGAVRSEETKEKLRQANLGKHYALGHKWSPSEETRKQMSQSAKNAWERRRGHDSGKTLQIRCSTLSTRSSNLWPTSRSYLDS